MGSSGPPALRCAVAIIRNVPRVPRAQYPVSYGHDGRIESKKIKSPAPNNATKLATHPEKNDWSQGKAYCPVTCGLTGVIMERCQETHKQRIYIINL
jgi:hypothetical protein